MKRRVLPLSVTLLLVLLASSRSAERAGSTATQTPPPVPKGAYLRVLGSVQDGGLPHAGCTCDRCRRALSDPRERRYVASLALVLPGRQRPFLFDATPDLREQLSSMLVGDSPATAGVDRNPVAGVFLTHAHIGHYLGLAFFGYESIHTSGMPVYASPRMAEFLRSNGPWSQLVELENIVLHELEPDRPRDLGDNVRVTALRAPHRDEFADTLGFLIEGQERSVFYLPDTDSWRAWPTPITEVLAGVDIALLDGTFYSAEELPGRRVEEIGHPLITTSMDLLQDLVDSGRIEIYFTHLNHSNPALDEDSEARQSLESRGFHVLTEGQEIPL